jgi:hypothetical protein
MVVIVRIWQCKVSYGDSATGVAGYESEISWQWTHDEHTSHRRFPDRRQLRWGSGSSHHNRSNDGDLENRVAPGPGNTSLTARCRARPMGCAQEKKQVLDYSHADGDTDLPFSYTGKHNGGEISMSTNDLTWLAGQPFGAPGGGVLSRLGRGGIR